MALKIEDTDSQQIDISGDNLTSNYLETREYCTACRSQDGVLKTVQIDIPGEGRFMLIATSCNSCEAKSSQMLPMTQLETTPMNIRGVINSLEDLYRYVYITNGARVIFFIDNFIYEFGSSNDIVGTIETLLFNAVDDISSAYEFARYTTNTGSDATLVKDLHSDNNEPVMSSSEASKSKLQLISSSEDLTERGKIKSLLETLKRNMQKPDFIIEVTDEQGTSRICPRNKLMSQCNFNDLSTYNDDNITHKFS